MTTSATRISQLEKSATGLDQRVHQLETSLADNAALFRGELLADLGSVVSAVGAINARLRAVEVGGVIAPAPTPSLTLATTTYRSTSQIGSVSGFVPRDVALDTRLTALGV